MLLVVVSLTAAPVLLVVPRALKVRPGVVLPVPLGRGHLYTFLYFSERAPFYHFSSGFETRLTKLDKIK